MDVKFINPFLQGTLEVLKKMAFIEPIAGKPYLKKDTAAAGYVSGIIGITGDAVGSLALSFSEPCICSICGSMLGESFAKANQEVFDAVGEITNMISGVARTYMEKDGMSVYAAIPTVIFGDHTVNHLLNSPSIVIPFSTDQGSFVVDVCIKKTAAEARCAENYQVVNIKTAIKEKALAVMAKRTAIQPPSVNKKSAQAATPAFTVKLPAETNDTADLDKKSLLKKKLKDIITFRDEIVRQLAEKPFMEISKRKNLKKRIPLLDAKIKRLKLDISALDVLLKVTQEDLDNPKIIQHYQHYDNKKRST